MSGPLWLITADGPERGMARRLEPGDEGALARQLAEGGAPLNFFEPSTGSPLRPGDVYELEGRMVVASSATPGWPDQTLQLPATVVQAPRIFHSAYLGRPFLSCLICKRDLAASGTGSYLIEKIHSRREVILECALCLPCAHRMNRDLSRESRERLEEYSREILAREPGLGACRRCGRGRDQLAGFNILTSALADRVYLQSWTLLCARCTDEMERMLSRATQDLYRDFIETHFPGLPNDIDVPRPVFL